MKENPEGKEMDRRTFMKSALAAGAGMALAASSSDFVWAKPGSEEEIADMSLQQLSKMIQSGELSSVKLVEIYLDRIRKYGGRNGVNAFITIEGEMAIKEAEELDKLAKAKRFKGPLHGMPIAVKDNLDTKDMRTTGGSKILAHWRPKQDANAVEKLRKAGAIIIGKTNMHEFAFGITTNNTAPLRQRLSVRVP
jgi:Asp-tRNA(Asn)/Glu-tRNA(Gln) amidotransferase A subunit family amidase